MALVVFGEKIDFTSIPYPEQGGYVVGYNVIGGLLSQMDYLGNVTVIGGSGGGALSTTLALGNNTGTYSIVLDSSITKGTNKILLDDNRVSITTANGNYNESYLYMNSTDTILGNGSSKSFRIESTGITTKWSDTDRQIINTNSYELFLNNLNTLQFGKLSSGAGSKLSALISTDNSTIGNGLVNTVVIGGQNIQALESNSVYVPYLLIQDGKVIKGTKGSGQIQFTETGDVISSNSNSVIGVISSTSSIAFTQNGIFVKDSATASSSPNIDSGITYVSTRNSSATASIKNSVVIGGQGLIATADDTVYLGNNVNINNAFTLPTTDGSIGQVLKTDGLGNVTWGGVAATLNLTGFGVTSSFYLQGTTDYSYDTTSAIYRTGNIGIGTASPSTKLHVYSTQSGAFRLEDGTQANGYILASDANGVASWTASTNVSNIVGASNSIAVFSGTNSIGNSAMSQYLDRTIVINNQRNLMSPITYFSIQRGQSQIDFILGNAFTEGDPNQTNEIISDNQNYGLRLSSKGMLSFRTGATYSENVRIESNGNVGIGLTGASHSASTKLHIYSTQSGAFRLEDGTQGVDKILTSDANGVASWASFSSTGGVTGPAGATGFGTTSSFYLQGTNEYSYDTTSDIYRTGYLNIGSGTATNGRFVVSSSGGTVSLIVDNRGNIYNNGIGNSILTTKFGYNALINSASSEYNTAFGYNTLSSSVGGSNNTAVGISALSNLINDFYNTAVGSGAAGTLKSGQANTAIGHGSYVGVTASGNVTIGSGGNELTTGTYNTFLGNNSGRFVTTGSYNIILGNNSSGLSLTTGSYNVIIGRPTSIGATTSNSVFISDNQGNTKVKFNSVGIMNITNVPQYTDNADAISNALVIGDVYRTGDFLKIVR